MIALVDCNNFFVSCERVFDPGLWSKPVAVLSSNDGCIIARSNEVKDMGVPMGAPAFKYERLLRQYDVVIRSSNFSLYTDMSRRVMATLREYTAGVEVYSVDEAFIELGDGRGYDEWAAELRRRVWRDTGIPVSVGIAPTKTLAKAAATLSKHRSGAISFADLDDAEVDECLQQLPVDKIWGVGSRLARQFSAYKVKTAYDLKFLPDKLLRTMTVPVQRTVAELRGLPAEIHSSDMAKSMISSRSFGAPVSSEKKLSEALSMHAVSLSSRMRQEKLAAHVIVAFISNGKGGLIHQASKTLLMASNSSSYLAALVPDLLSRIYKPGLWYKKAGMAAHRLEPAHARQLTLDSDVEWIYAAEKIDTAFDAINRKWGAQSLKIAAEGINQSWRPRHDLRSPRYTTEWSDIKTVR